MRLGAIVPAGVSGPPGSIPFAALLACAADPGKPPGDVGIAKTEGRKAGVRIGLPVIGFAEFAVPQEVAVILGAEIVSERRSIFPAIFKERSDHHNRHEDAGNKDYGANEKHEIRKMVHCVLLCDGCPQRPGAAWQASRELPWSVRQAGAGRLVNIAQIEIMMDANPCASGRRRLAPLFHSFNQIRCSILLRI
jgi:hypothetical protein